MPSIKLFVGLGNPGDKFKNTRHNFGFITLDAIAEAKHLEFKTWNDVADISFYESNAGKIWLLKPMTFMNNSGDPIAAFARYYKISPKEIFVFYDDFAIEMGEFRLRTSGSSAGHNGIKSIIEYLNTQDFPRMKLGIGPYPKFMQMPDFVLSKFHEDDKEKIKEVSNIAVKLFEEICEQGLEKAISKVSVTFPLEGKGRVRGQSLGSAK